MLLAPAVFAKVGEAEVAGAVVDEAEAVGHRALLVVLELLVLAALLHLLPEADCEGGHGGLIFVLDCAWALGDDALEDVPLLQTVFRVLVQALEADLVVAAGEQAFAVGLDALAGADGADGIEGRRLGLLLQLEEVLLLLEVDHRGVHPRVLSPSHSNTYIILALKFTYLPPFIDPSYSKVQWARNYLTAFSIPPSIFEKSIILSNALYY